MSDAMIPWLGLGLLTGLFAAYFALGMRRRKRIWFVGGGRTVASRLAELRALQLRELRDLEDGHSLGKINDEDFNAAKEALLLELSRTTKELDSVETEREDLKKRFNLPALVIGLIALAAAAPSLQAQSPLELKSTYQAPQGSGNINFELRDQGGSQLDFSEAVVAALILEDNELPFNELTQTPWTRYFRALTDIDSPNPGANLMPFGDSERPVQGYAWRSNSLGKFDVSGVVANRRLAFAAHFQGIWWPLIGERVLPMDGTFAYVVLEVAQVSEDTSPLRITEYNLEVKDAEDSGTSLRWHQVDIIETITIDNPTLKAIAKGSDTEGDAWISLHIPKPPIINSAEMLSLMANTWNYFVGVERPAPNDEALRQDLIKGVRPYVPWSKGLDWGAGGSAMHGGQDNRVYTERGAKDSGMRTHPLNLEGRYTLLNAGDIAVSEREANDGIKINIYKPVPPKSRMVILVTYKAGIAFDDPSRILIDRSFLPAAIQEMNALVEPGYTLMFNGQPLPFVEEN
ncbi:MAG: hypothetical protein KDB07_09565, partial [Planctomycetes bacterium]|nr:hypothetical protein [Planctomycetota bacterium]